jgi:serine/threonine-protein kinase
MSQARLQRGSDSDLPTLPVPGETVHGRYRIEQELGRGGMGIVLAAHDQMLGRRVALKLLMPHLMRSPEAVTRFGNEARSLAQLDSPHVVRVLDYGLVSGPDSCCGLPFMVLELLRGEDLFSLVARDGALSPSRVVRYALQACAGLAAAHAQGIVHRDLKPENLFLSVEPDGSECIKVLDFGIARSRDRRALTKGHGVGSPGYMAPEQVEGTQVDSRADIWALGVVMYELLARRPAFVGDNAQSLCLQILTAPITPLLELRPELPPALVFIVERCMERDPDRRFANVAELADALAPLDQHDPETEAERIRRRLGSVDDDEVISDVRPRQERALATGDIVATAPGRRERRLRRRRVVSVLAVTFALVPMVALLPQVKNAPELAPLRAWSAQAVEQTRETYAKVHARARELWMKEPAGKPVPGEQP